jgi:hypothetical protein
MGVPCRLVATVNHSPNLVETARTSRVIQPEDIEFHLPPNADHTWAETNYFCLSIPEEKLVASVYTVTRKGLGVQLVDVVVFGALSDSRAECLYVDSQQHLPAPARLSDYTTPNGLRVQAFSPRDYRVDYIGYDGTELHFDFRGLMAPFDIHDPAHSPNAQLTEAGRAASSGFGAAYGNHFDLTGHITGSLKLRGRKYAIDCVETMDHSWGPRVELGMATMGWTHAHFGQDFAIHWINKWDPDHPGASEHTLAHGYVLDHGIAYGLTDMKLDCIHIGSVLTGIEAEVTDKRGKVFKMLGTALVGAPWVPYSSGMLYVSLMRWMLAGGGMGYGLGSYNISMQALNQRHGRRWTDPQPTATS